MQTIKILQKTAQPFIDLAIDTIEKNKQALIFVNSKKSAEKSAEEISKKIKQSTEELNQLSEIMLTTLSIQSNNQRPQKIRRIQRPDIHTSTRIPTNGSKSRQAKI